MKIVVAYIGNLPISTDNIAVTREFRASVGATWTFLDDPAVRGAVAPVDPAIC